jgi:large subunit ribosomal protein L4
MATVTKQPELKTSKAATKSKTVAKKTVSVATASLPLKIKDNASYADLFNEPRNSALTAQYVRTYQANQRQGTAQTKTRGDVSGSGKKPWKQKGTGRSRVGSIRTPVWRHGGVSHGPVAKDWRMTMPKKMKAKAFLSALSDKVARARAFYLEDFTLTEGRTKEVVALTKGWNLHGKLLLVVAHKNHNLEQAAGNVSYLQVVSCANLNAYQLLGADIVVFEHQALDQIAALTKEKYAKN